MAKAHEAARGRERRGDRRAPGEGPHQVVERRGPVAVEEVPEERRADRVRAAWRVRAYCRGSARRNASVSRSALRRFSRARLW